MSGSAFALHALLTAALYYLAARAEVTRSLWTRYPAALDRVALCPACAGFWIGGAVAAAGAAVEVLAWRLVPLLALTAIVTTPILWGAMAFGLHAPWTPEVPDAAPPP